MPRAWGVDLTPANCLQIRRGLRLSVKTLTDVLALTPKTVERWERQQRAWRNGLAGDFMGALAIAMCGLGPDAAWGPDWLSRGQRLVWILRAAAASSRDSCIALRLTTPLTLEALQPAERFRYRPAWRPWLEPEAPTSQLCRRVRRGLGLHLKEVAYFLATTDNTIGLWESRPPPPRGLEIDCYRALAASLPKFGRVATWGPPELERERRLLHVLQMGLLADPRLCKAQGPELCSNDTQQPILPERWVSVAPQAQARRAGAR